MASYFVGIVCFLMKYHTCTLYFSKIRKDVEISSAAVVIGALRVKTCMRVNPAELDIATLYAGSECSCETLVRTLAGSQCDEDHHLRSSFTYL